MIPIASGEGDVMSEANSRQDDDGTDDRSSDALDLFFDLVFDYAMSEVTQPMLTAWLGIAARGLALASPAGLRTNPRAPRGDKQ